jgi:uncharacterized protein
MTLMATSMNSRLYECHVMHARFRPRAHRFAYRIFMLALDLDELDALDRRLRLFSLHRPNLYRFCQEDYLPLSDTAHLPTPEQRASTTPSTGLTSLKARVLAYLAAHGIDPGPGCRVELITLPRLLGYQFNPVSFYFIYDAAGQAVAALPEVTNTFREMKPYLLGPTDRRDGVIPLFHRRVPKAFYVSPFSDVDVAFDFQLRVPGERLSIQIDDYDAQGRTLTSTLTGRAQPLGDGALACFLVKYPLLTARVMALIHWHAFRLWLKKVPWFAKSARPSDQRGLYRPHDSLGPSALPAPDA